jgi:hypothetical protein
MDSIVEGGKFTIECPVKIDHREVRIIGPNAVYSAYPRRTWTLALPRDIVVLHTISSLGVWYLYLPCVECWEVPLLCTIFGFPKRNSVS